MSALDVMGAGKGELTAQLPYLSARGTSSSYAPGITRAELGSVLLNKQAGGGSMGWFSGKEQDSKVAHDISTQSSSHDVSASSADPINQGDKQENVLNEPDRKLKDLADRFAAFSKSSSGTRINVEFGRRLSEPVDLGEAILSDLTHLLTMVAGENERALLAYSSLLVPFAKVFVSETHVENMHLWCAQLFYKVADEIEDDFQPILVQVIEDCEDEDAMIAWAKIVSLYKEFMETAANYFD